MAIGDDFVSNIGSKHEYRTISIEQPDTLHEHCTSINASTAAHISKHPCTADQ